MIKNYMLFKESLLDKLQGPTEEEIWGIIKNYSPDNLLKYSIKNKFRNGIIKAIDNGADFYKINYINYSNVVESGETYNLWKAIINEDIDGIINSIKNGADINPLSYFDKYGHNESLLDKIEGPSKEYLWKHWGFEKSYEPEEFFKYLTDGIEQISPNGLYYEWKKNGKVVFEQYITPEKLIFIGYSNIFRIYEIVFDMNFNEFSVFMKDMFNKYFSDEINIYEYNFRIKYKY